MKTGLKLIKRERRKNAKLYTEDHDDQHRYADLAVVAAALAVYGTDAVLHDPLDRVDERSRRDGWGLLYKHAANRIKVLAIAGALIAAEIDRLLRCKRSEKLRLREQQASSKSFNRQWAAQLQKQHDLLIHGQGPRKKPRRKRGKNRSQR